MLVTEVGSAEWPATVQAQPAVPLQKGLEVMVRPDCLECHPSDQGQGTILNREFRGAFYLYRVSLPSGHAVRCLLSHTEEYPIGTRVCVRLRHGHWLRPFADGRAIGQ
jgi:hypothetical protein